MKQTTQIIQLKFDWFNCYNSNFFLVLPLNCWLSHFLTVLRTQTILKQIRIPNPAFHFDKYNCFIRIRSDHIFETDSDPYCFKEVTYLKQ